MPTGRTSLAGMVRRHRDQPPATPVELVLQLTAKLEPPLIQNGLVQTRLGSNLPAGPLAAALSRSAQVLDPQVLNTHHRVVLDDSGRTFVQEVPAHLADSCVNALNLGFGFLPVLTEFHLAAHGSLIATQPRLVALEAVKRGDKTALAEGGEASDSNVDPNGAGGDGDRLLDLDKGLDTDVPGTGRLADRQVP